MSDRSQIVVRLPHIETNQLAELCEHYGVTRSRMIRRLIREAHVLEPTFRPVEPPPSKLALKLEERAQVRLRNRRSGLQKVEPPACEAHEWTALGDGLDQCQICLAVKA